MDVLQWFFPPHCPFCHAVIPAGHTTCANCSPKHQPVHKAHHSGGCSCFAPFLYIPPYKLAVWNLKFNHKPDYAVPMANSMAETLLYHRQNNFDVVTFVPLTKKRKQERGYNQAEKLAKALARLLHVPCKPLLKKVAENKPQHKLPRAERLSNVIGVYQPLDPKRTEAKHILLVDDICTTGATLQECTRMLKAANAKQVVCTTYALVEKY